MLIVYAWLAWQVVRILPELRTHPQLLHALGGVRGRTRHARQRDTRRGAAYPARGRGWKRSQAWMCRWRRRWPAMSGFSHGRPHGVTLPVGTHQPSAPETPTAGLGAGPLQPPRRRAHAPCSAMQKSGTHRLAASAAARCSPHGQAAQPAADRSAQPRRAGAAVPLAAAAGPGYHAKGRQATPLAPTCHASATPAGPGAASCAGVA